MSKELLMKVGVIIKDSSTKNRIVGAAEPKYSIEDLSWLNVENKNIMIQTREGEFLFKVIKVDVFTSISYAINIGLTLEEKLQFEKISIGDNVFKLKER